MMSWLVAWTVVPVFTVALSVGLGLMAERATLTRLPAPVVVVVGMSLLVVLTTLLTAAPLTTAIAGPALVVLSLAGWLLGRPSLRARRPRRWSSLAALAVFACYAAPVALSGGPSWGGFIKLDDTATWMALADRLGTDGRTTDGLAQSTYGVLVRLLFDQGYPVGAFADLGVIGRLLGQDVAWVVAPLMATLAAGLGWALYAATTGLIRSSVWRGVVAFVAATSTLLVGYVQWGGIKEVTLALLLTTCCVLLTQGPRDPRPLLSQAGLVAIPMAGVLVLFGIAGFVYLLPLGLAELALVWRSYGARRVPAAAAVFVAVFAVLGLPTFLLLSQQWATYRDSSLNGSQDIGNLFAPLKIWQVFGVWPTGDFRVVPEAVGLTVFLVALVAVGMVAGTVVAVRARKPTVPVFVAMSLAVSIWSAFGNAWLEGKVLAVASPAMLLAAGVAFAWLAEHDRLFEGLALAGVVGLGVVASNVMVYREVWVAPADRMQELATIGALDAPTPALILEYSAPGARHFLRGLDAEGAGELRYNEIPMYSGVGLTKGAYADIDDFPITSLAPYPTLVLRTEIVGSRPPSTYSLARSGTYYDVWGPDPAAPAILQHWPLGDHSDPAADAPCAVVTDAIAAAGPTGRVAAAIRAPQSVVDLAAGDLPAGWTAGEQPGSVAVTEPGSVTRSFEVPAAGRYRMTLGGSLWGGVRVTVDGTEVWSGRGRLNWSPYSNPLPSVELAAGTHTVVVDYTTGLRPGEGYTPSQIGPIVASTTGSDVPVTYLSPTEALSLCGQRLDWVEAVGP
jgi:hypothetical protein